MFIMAKTQSAPEEMPQAIITKNRGPASGGCFETMSRK